MGVLSILLIGLSALGLTYAAGMFITLRLAIILCLAVWLFAVSLLVMPVAQTAPDGLKGDTSGLGEALAFIFIAAPAAIGSTLGLIAAWIVKRMRETAV